MGNFEESFNSFSEDEDMEFIRQMLLQEACELQEAYQYLYDANRQYQNDKLTTIVEYVRLSKIAIENAFDIIDNDLLDKSDVVDYNWIPNSKKENEDD